MTTPPLTSAPRLEEITSANLEAALGIRVLPEQEFAVSPVVKSLAEAYVHPGVAWPRLIVDGGRPVGFLMAFLDIDWGEDGTLIRSGLWRLNIAAAARSCTSPGTPATTARRASTPAWASATPGSGAGTRRWGY